MVPCGMQCFGCTDKYDKYTLPIVYEEVIKFLDSSYVDNQLGLEIIH